LLFGATAKGRRRRGACAAAEAVHVGYKAESVLWRGRWAVFPAGKAGV